MNQIEKNRRTTLIALIAVMVGLAIWCTCGARAAAQCSWSPALEPPSHEWPDPCYQAKTDPNDSPTEALTDTTSVLNQSGHKADSGLVESGQGLGGVPDEYDRDFAAADHPDSRDPFATNWLEVGYAFDNRQDERILTFEGSSSPHERVDVWGKLDLRSGLDDDLARFSLRAGVFGRTAKPYGAGLWFEDFTGSWNEHIWLGAYYDVLLGGERPFVRLVGLPVSSDDGGMMARAMFDVALHERWSVAGFLESSWGGQDGDYSAAEPALRYLITKGVWATLEYRRDERRGDDSEGLALGLRAGL